MHWGLNWECIRKTLEIQLGCSGGGTGMSGMQLRCHAGEVGMLQGDSGALGGLQLGFSEDAVGLC